jgi:hypothetical protein
VRGFRCGDGGALGRADPGAPGAAAALGHDEPRFGSQDQFLSDALARPLARALRTARTRGRALAPEDGERLALALLEAVDVDALATARVIARESGGSPFLIEELVRSNRGAVSPEKETMAVLTLDQLVSQDLGRLPDRARRWLEIVAVAGCPLPMPLVLEASGIEGPQSKRRWRSCVLTGSSGQAFAKGAKSSRRATTDSARRLTPL